MEIVKKIFPLSWAFTKSVGNFVVGIILHLILGTLFGLVAGLAKTLVGWIPVVGDLLIWALGVIGSLIGVYALVGLILLILVYCKVIKD
ncbi:MAG: hypothetical protein J6L85_03320 [Clostridia bacterium]|nr:hypothetical protein [Clostridia bacterium]